jgi:serine/threonine-protein kinase
LSGKRGDARSDVYSLGVILYEMLTGKTPFQGIDPFEREGIHPFEYLGKRPASISQLESSISRELEQVIYHALQPSPAKRYANAHEMAHDLKHLDQVEVRQPLLKSSRARALRARKALAYASLALLPILIFALLFWFARR